MTTLLSKQFDSLNEIHRSIIDTISNPTNEISTPDLGRGIMIDNIEINTKCCERLINTKDKDDISKLVVNFGIIPQLIKFVKCNDKRFDLLRSYSLQLLFEITQISSPKQSGIDSNCELIPILIQLISSRNLNHQKFSILILSNIAGHSFADCKELINEHEFLFKITAPFYDGHPYLGNYPVHIDILESIAFAFKKISDTLDYSQFEKEVQDGDVNLEVFHENLYILLCYDDSGILKHALDAYSNLFTSNYFNFYHEIPKQCEIIRWMNQQFDIDEKLVLGFCRKQQTTLSVPNVISQLVNIYFTPIAKKETIESVHVNPYTRCIALLQHPCAPIKQKAIQTIYESFKCDVYYEVCPEMIAFGAISKLKIFIGNTNEQIGLWNAFFALVAFFTYFSVHHESEQCDIELFVMCLNKAMAKPIDERIKEIIESGCAFTDYIYDDGLNQTLQNAMFSTEEYIIKENREIFRLIMENIVDLQYVP